jgi:lysine/ornithine N-monooxygenase
MSVRAYVRVYVYQNSNFWTSQQIVVGLGIKIILPKATQIILLS